MRVSSGLSGAIILFVLLASACSTSSNEDTGGFDAASAPDGSPAIDAAPAYHDAQAMDAVAVDAFTLDAQSQDASSDASPDASPDVGVSDGGAPDATITCPDAGASTFCTGIRIALLGVPGQNGSSNFLAWLQSNGQRVVRFQTTTHTSSTSSVTATLLSSFDVVILDQLVRDYTSTEAVALRDWVASGGGVMSMSGYTGAGPDYTRPNTLLAAIGLEYTPPLQNGPVTSFHPHPVTAGLSSVTFNGGYLVGAVPGVSGGINTITATIANGPVEIVQERGQGRVVVWGDEWVQFDSEWRSMPMIRQFWVDVLGWLVHQR